MDLPDEHTIRILITTDNHVGYNENDPITGDDAWMTFHEIMMLAKNNNVDMVIQAGDLFHVNKPSKKSMYQVMKSLRLACMGDKPCELELLSDPAQVFYYNEFTNVNYEDPNFNVAIPVFGISGNHDDATGDSLLCPMDILHVSGLLNHFGKVLESDKIKVVPLLFQKGNTKLALYGMASVRDERLFRTFKENGVEFEVPTMCEGEWFNIMCVHQNHTGHTNTAFLPEQFLPDFLDLVIWGHEHECVPHLVHNPTKNFDVLQPGSSVATSLCEAEAQPKNVFILEIRYDQPVRLITIPLTTVRTFKMKSISLQDVEFLRPHDKEGIMNYLVSEVEKMIDEANEETKQKLGPTLFEDDADPMSAQLPLPLIRLRVDYSAPSSARDSNPLDYQVENPRRFSNRFVGRVANGNNVVQFYKRRRKTSSGTTLKRGSLEVTSRGDSDARRLINNSSNGELEVEVLIDDLLSKMQLSLLPEVGMNEAVKRFVDKDEKAALKDFISKEIDNEVNILVQNKQFLENEDPVEMKNLIKQVKRANTAVSADSTDSQKSNIYTGPNNEHREVEDNSKTEDTILSGAVQARSSGRRPRGRPPRGKLAPTTSEPDSIIISEDKNDNYGDYGNNNNNDDDDDDDIIAVSSEDSDEDMIPSSSLPSSSIIGTGSTRKSKGIGRGAASARTRSTEATRTRGKTKTPRTDVLSALLARKAR